MAGIFVSLFLTDVSQAPRRVSVTEYTSNNYLMNKLKVMFYVYMPCFHNKI